MAYSIGKLPLLGGILFIFAAQQAMATEIVLRGPDGRTNPIHGTEVVAPDGTTKTGDGGGKSVVDLSGTPSTLEQIVVVRDSRGYIGATTVRGAPNDVAIDSATMISLADMVSSRFAGNQAAAAEAAVKACDRAAYDAAVARLENYLLINRANLQKRDAELVRRSQSLRIPPQRSVKDLKKFTRDMIKAAEAGFGDQEVMQNLRNHYENYSAFVEDYENLADMVAEAEKQRANIGPFPQPCDKQVGFLGSDGKQGFGVAFGIGRSQYDFPNYRAYSLEDMGVFIKTDIVDEDRDVSVFDAFGTGYFYIPGTETALRISGRITDMSSRSKLNLMVAPEMGQRFAFPTPDGGFFTTNPVDRFRVEQEFRQYQVSGQIERGFNLGTATVRPYVGVNFSFLDAQDSSSFKIPVSSVRFEEWRSLDTFGGGPILGFDVEVPIEGGMYGFGGIGGELRWNSSQAKWKTQVDIMGVTTDTQSTKESDDQMTWGASASLGIGYRSKGFDLRVYGTAGMSNHYPYLDVESDVGDGDPSIEWNNTRFWGVRLELGARF